MENIYNKEYQTTPNLFGKNPEQILVNYINLFENKHPILDVGIGQGRNSFFLAENGYSVVGIDSSEAGLELVSSKSNEKQYDIKTQLTSFENYDPENQKFGGILIFGLIQILTWEEIFLLKNKINEWIIEDGVLFVTGFTIFDASYNKYKSEWKSIGKNSFGNNNNIRTYLELGEIISLFNNFENIHHWEGFGPEHRHGKGPIEKHHMVEAIFRKIK